MLSAVQPSVRKLVRFGILVACLAPARAATLARLTLADMVSNSSAIVHGRVTGASTAWQGSIIHTHYQIQVIEQWKGATQSSVDVAVPGGVLNGIRQTFSGAPDLNIGQEYVLFLWTSRHGITYTLGFTQGVFSLSKNASGQTMAARAPTTETLLDPSTGRPVKDQPVSLPLTQLVSLINAGGATW
jgi:hypothetical protein